MNGLWGPDAPGGGGVMSRNKVIAIVAAVVVVGAVGLGVLLWNFAAPPEAAPQPGSTPVVSQSVEPTPSTWPTPTPGATETIDPGEPEEVPIDETATVAGGAAVRIVDVESYEAGDEPGQLAGPAVTVTIEVTNDGETALDTRGSSLNLNYGDDRTPAPSFGDPVRDGLPASIEPGATATGKYSFGLPLDVRDDVRVILDLVSGEPQVVFVGSMAGD
jgi:hypothetical protein